MTNHRWDPSQYLKFGDERTRPFVDLIARIPGDARTVVDLGCGAGNDVAPLRARFPGAAIHGVDSSAEMIDRARSDIQDPNVSFEVADAAAWRPDGARPDVIVSNAMFQWIDRHIELLPGIADAAAQAFAFQVPGNQDAPSHALLAEVAAEFGITGYRTVDVRDPAEYLAALHRPGWTVDVWETTYLHVLQGADAVFEWISGTGARPVLARLDGAVKDDFVARYKAELNSAYPPQEYGTVLPFRRIFAVAARN
ncbi:methyltransferase domain-containing protein [Tsukamurella strandjordii]|uniref:Methyltransferase domain-containing protein n=1 Tax=Tsukamurella strandjordii TaxID=147577 RepID=A0AA90SP81_9ACTN|nr:methyltransferase domain-containing protein [Tsukamurella strandjordii]MDP0396801.1 methyltransferase domain-containing protein [Tsukamurella strandjordii]